MVYARYFVVSTLGYPASPSSDAKNKKIAYMKKSVLRIAIGSVLKFGLRTVRLFGGQAVIRWVNRGLRKFVSFTHYVQFIIEWVLMGKNMPHWYDHNLGLYHFWHETRNPLPYERGIFNLLAMRQGAQVLDLCCGDGFFANYFYSNRAGHVISLDVDLGAIQSARRNYSSPNVEYRVANVLTQMPEGKFDNIIWEGALEYFTEDEIQHVMRSIKSRLTDGGILSGYANIQTECCPGQKYVFKNRADFLRFLQPYFSNIRVFETIYPSRQNLYFFAGEGTLPFDGDWDLQTILHQARVQ